MTAKARSVRALGSLRLSVLAAALALAWPASAQQDMQRIAAVVNDDIISFFDLNARIHFTIASTNTRDTPENRKRLQQQVLRGLIDEKLQKQEAAKNSIKITEQDINRAMADLEKQNNMPVGGLDSYMQSNDVPKSTLTAQVEAGLAWQKLVQRKVRSRVDIGDDEVDEMLKRIEANRGQPELHVAEIFLTVDSPDQEDEVMRNVERIIDQLQSGARFGALARQFSQSASAAGGGDLGWLQQGQLDEQIDEVLKQMPPGTISKPIRTIGGFHLMALIERRRADGAAPRIDLHQGMLPLPQRAPPAEIEDVKARLSAAARGAKNCDAFDAAIKELPRGRSVNLGKLALNELPGPLQAIIDPMKPGQVTQPLQADAATVMVLMVCARDDGEPAPLPSRDDIRERLSAQRVDLMARRYLRDLRRAAFIDPRI